MQPKIFIAFIFSALLITACDFNILSNNEKQAALADESTVVETLLHVSVTGGIAGVDQSLTVNDAGLASYVDSFRPGAKWARQLSASELEDLTNLMLSNGFLQLQDQYIDAQVADAFLYTISFTHEGVTHTVQTDDFGAPENLKRIVTGIVKIISEMTGNGLVLEMSLSTLELKPGENIDLGLNITNIGSDAMTLNFLSGQVFDFCALPVGDTATNENLVWNWAHDKVFTLALWQLELQPGETRSYQISWDGRDNSGEQLNGDFAIQAKLVSLPGGTAEQKILHISN